MNTTCVPNTEATSIEEISEALSHSCPVDRIIKGIGRLHIDRHLPYLCVYRQPRHHDDSGTKQLLMGQASYLSTSAGHEKQGEVLELIRRIALYQRKLFGSFLLVEIWASEEETSPSETDMEPAFHIHAPHHNVPNKVLDDFDAALEEIRLRHHASQIRISFDDQTTPDALPPLLPPELQKDETFVVLGVEVKPVFRDAATCELLPFALRTVRRGFTHALRKACYSFSHNHTRFRPAHYHELGSQIITKAVTQADRALAQISERFDLLIHVTPVNTAAACNQFEQNDYRGAPEFHYRPRHNDPALLKRELYAIPLEEIEDPTLEDLFTHKRDELDRQLSLLNDRNTPAFLHGSLQLFGQVDNQLLEAAQTILDLPLPDPGQEAQVQMLDAEAFAQKAREEMEYYRRQAPSLVAKVEIRPDITGLLVSHGNLLIGSDARVAPARVEASLAHEIGTHCLTYHNGRMQPFRQLYAGMAGYEELQEGLAVLAEYLCGGLTLSRLRILAGRVMAVHSISEGADFNETFELLRRDFRFQPDTAFHITMRVYRGGGYTKDMIYLRGLMGLINYLGKGGELELLYSGKVAMSHLPLMEELRWREVLRPLSLKPRHLDAPDALKRLQRLRDSASLDTLIASVT